jgi:hypothetical protein
LSHLDDFTFDLVVPSKDGKPEQRYEIGVVFSMHCFTTTEYAEDGTWPREREYRDSREARLFDEERYELSKHLPEIVRGISNRQCFLDPENDRDYFLVERIGEEESRSYHVFFKLSQAASKKQMTLYVKSAYVPDRPARPKKPTPVRFSVIAHNVKIGKSVKKPR